MQCSENLLSRSTLCVCTRLCLNIHVSKSLYEVNSRFFLSKVHDVNECYFDLLRKAGNAPGHKIVVAVLVGVFHVLVFVVVNLLLSICCCVLYLLSSSSSSLLWLLWL